MSIAQSAIVGESLLIFMNLLSGSNIRTGIFMQHFLWRCDLCLAKSKNRIVEEQLRSTGMAGMNGSTMDCVYQMELGWEWIMKFSSATTRENGFRQIN